MILKFLKEETQLKKCNSKTESKGSKTVSMTKASLKLAKSFFQKNWPKKKKTWFYANDHFGKIVEKFEPNLFQPFNTMIFKKKP